MFGCLPSELDAELARTPAGLLDAIVEVRAYVAVKTQYEAAEKKDDIPDSPLVEIVKAFEFERYQRAVHE